MPTRTLKASTTSPPAWKIRINTGNGFAAPIDPGAGAAALNAYPADETIDAKRRGVDNGMRFADMNGDGRDDILLLIDPSSVMGFHPTAFAKVIADIL